MYVLSLLLHFLTLASVVTSQTLQHIKEDWMEFKIKYNRTYSSQREEHYRFNVFAQNAKNIFRHNLAADKGRYSYWMKINNFSDMTEEEFNKYYIGSTITSNANRLKQKTMRHFNLSLPREIDWRQKNCVTNVKDQGYCQSCYAFAVTGALESHQCIKTGRLVSLSEQNIIDCTTGNSYGNNGCNKGSVDYSFTYVIENGGIDTEKSYSYIGKVSDCRFKKYSIGATARRYIDVSGGDMHLQEIVANVGPVAVCLDVTGLSRHYDRGVYDGKSDINGKPYMCSRSHVNHAMLVVGYGSTSDGKNYWLIKNSWGKSWGIDGYLKLARNYNDTCGISSYTSFPVI